MTCRFLSGADGLWGLQGRDVRRLQAFGPALRLVADFLAFGEGLEAIAADFREMREQIVAAGVGRNEAEALAIVEPLDGTGIHKYFLNTNY